MSAREALRARVLWFAVGAGVNHVLIATPFRWLRAHTDLPLIAISALSIGFSATFFFGWNFFLNFRSGARKRDALPRYLAAVIVMAALSSVLLTVLKRHGAHTAFNAGGYALDLDIVATQCFLAGLKFLLYHAWVFPLPKGPA